MNHIKKFLSLGFFLPCVAMQELPMVHIQKAEDATRLLQILNDKRAHLKLYAIEKRSNM